MAEEAQPLTVPDADHWWAWLEEHHGEVPAGVWLTLAKGGAREPTSLTYAEALQAALAFGWIDGQTRGRDDTCYCQRWTPRRARSIWSKRNVGYAEQLIAEGRMQPAGLAEVERATAAGRRRTKDRRTRRCPTTSRRRSPPCPARRRCSSSSRARTATRSCTGSRT